MKRRTKIKVEAWQFTFCWLQEKHQILAQVRFFKKATEIWRNIPVLLDLNFEVYLKFISIFWEGRKEWLNTPVFLTLRTYLLGNYLASMKGGRFWSPLRRFKHQLEYFAQFFVASEKTWTLIQKVWVMPMINPMKVAWPLHG